MVVKQNFKMKIKTRHGHYSDLFEEEAKRIQKMYKEVLGIELTFTEATAIAGQRSADTIWDEKKLRGQLARIRGVL